LRALGRQPVDHATRIDHLERVAGVVPRERRRNAAWPAAATLLVGIILGGVAAASNGSGEKVVRTVPAHVGDVLAPPAGSSAVVDPFPADACKGPPPFAGRPPEGATEVERAANRGAEAKAFEEFRAANCPAETDGAPSLGTTGMPHDPFPADPCKGPPPFAGRQPEGLTEAERASNRGLEAEAFAEFRAANCPAEDEPGGPPPRRAPAG